MYWEPGPAIWQAHYEDCEWRAEKREEFSKKPEVYLEGVVETTKKVLGYLKFKSFLKSANPLNYGNSKIIEALEDYKIANEILYEKELKGASLKKLLDEGKGGFLSKLVSNSNRNVRRKVAKNLLRKRIPRRNRELFPNFY